MSTRLRVIYVHGGTGGTGYQAQRDLTYLCLKYGKPVPSTGISKAKWFKAMYDQIPSQYRGILFILREPRNVSFSRSRFRQLCRHFNINGRKPKKQVIARRGVSNGAPPDRRVVFGSRGIPRIPAPPIPRAPQRPTWERRPTNAGLFGTTVPALAMGGGVPSADGVAEQSRNIDQWRIQWSQVTSQIPPPPPEEPRPQDTVPRTGGRIDWTEIGRRANARRAAQEFAALEIDARNNINDEQF
jgi:hypothetical protein